MSNSRARGLITDFDPVVITRDSTSFLKEITACKYLNEQGLCLEVPPKTYILGLSYS